MQNPWIDGGVVPLCGYPVKTHQFAPISSHLRHPAVQADFDVRRLQEWLMANWMKLNVASACVCVCACVNAWLGCCEIAGGAHVATVMSSSLHWYWGQCCRVGVYTRGIVDGFVGKLFGDVNNTQAIIANNEFGLWRRSCQIKWSNIVTAVVSRAWSLTTGQCLQRSYTCLWYVRLTEDEYRLCSGVGAQTTLGEYIFVRKFMYEKLTKCPNFAW